jgi:hypothetical protein
MPRITPNLWFDTESKEDWMTPIQAQRTMRAMLGMLGMLGMKKIDLGALPAAADQS